ncbi:MAG: peptide-methionine (R)-S-oxide reductase MsrB [Bacillota bacterium]
MKLDGKYPIEVRDDFWQRVLNEDQYRILKEEGTEPAFNNQYYDCQRKGIYSCAACGQQLFSSTDKFKSGTGWPSFKDVIEEGVVATAVDNSLATQRTEVHCSRCGGHLGHLFNDGPQPTGLRYCMNSGALEFLQEAYLAMGCFWGPDAIFGAVDGIYSTVVGYAGGSESNPTYKQIKDHTETVKLLYNPDKIEYRQLLEIFWKNHTPADSSSTLQYRSIILYDNPKQQDEAAEFLAEKEAEKTALEALDKFYQAEDYHQKYQLRQRTNLFSLLLEIYQSKERLIKSQSAAWLNALAQGLLSAAEVEAKLKNSFIYLTDRKQVEKIIAELK